MRVKALLTTILFSVLSLPVADGSGGACEVCCGNSFDDLHSGAWALTVYLIALFIMFWGIAIVTDEFLVPALQNMAFKMNLSDDVAGATLLAMASSAPELFISLAGTFQSGNSVGVGAIVGSAIFNILVIIAFTGVFAPSVLDIDWKPFSRDIFFYVLSIVLLMAAIKWIPHGEGKEGLVYWWEGLILFLTYFLYVAWMAYNDTLIGLTCDKAEACVMGDESDDEDSIVMTDFKSRPTAKSTIAKKAQNMDITQNSQRKEILLRPKLLYFRHKFWAVTTSGADEMMAPEDEEDKSGPIWGIIDVVAERLSNAWIFLFSWTIVNCNIEDVSEKLSEYGLSDDEKKTLVNERTRIQNWTVPSFILCILWIGALCQGMVCCAEKAGCIMGIPTLVMGLTVLAAGTSVPDAMGSIAAARMGQGDMGVANAIGSNVFDILIGLGFPWFLYGVVYSGKAFPVDADDVLTPLILLFSTVGLTVLCFVATGWKLGKQLGMFLFCVYIAFCVYTIATGEESETAC